jgi:hypothetical protein
VKDSDRRIYLHSHDNELNIYLLLQFNYIPYPTMTAFTETEVIARMTFHSKSKDKKTRRIKEFSFMFAPTETNYLTFLQTILKKHDLFQYTVSDQCTFPCTVKLPPSKYVTIFSPHIVLIICHSSKSTLYVVNFAKYKILANNILKEQPTSPITVFINMAAVETAFSQVSIANLGVHFILILYPKGELIGR